MSNIDPLYDSFAVCRKCGCNNIGAEYRVPVPSGFGPECPDPPPWIQRTCTNCKYSWTERPLDTATHAELYERRGGNPFVYAARCCPNE